MNSDLASGVTGISVVLTLFLLLLAVLWVLIPFAIFGIKPLLRKIGSEVFRANTLLEQIHKELQVQNGRAGRPEQP